MTTSDDVYGLVGRLMSEMPPAPSRDCEPVFRMTQRQFDALVGECVKSDRASATASVLPPERVRLLGHRIRLDESADAIRMEWAPEEVGS